VFETGLFGKGDCNWPVCERCLKMVCLGKVIETGQCAKGV
jgi:hypothetical protein